MNLDFPLLILSLLSLGSLILSFVFVVGIVWRVELELDLSFKFLAAAVFLLLLVEGIPFFPFQHTSVWWLFVLPGLKLIASLNLLFSLFFMRDLIRRLDGEKPGSE